MTKKVVRLTENDLHRIVKESVNRVLKEEYKFGRGTPVNRLWDNNSGKQTFSKVVKNVQNQPV